MFWLKRSHALAGTSLDRTCQLLAAVGVDRGFLPRAADRDISGFRVNGIRPETLKVRHRPIGRRTLAAMHGADPAVANMAITRLVELQGMLPALGLPHGHGPGLGVDRCHRGGRTIDPPGLTVVARELHPISGRELTLPLGKAVRLTPAPFVEPPVDRLSIGGAKLDPVGVPVDPLHPVRLAFLDAVPIVAASERNHVAGLIAARVPRFLTGQPLVLQSRGDDPLGFDGSVSAQAQCG